MYDSSKNRFFSKVANSQHAQPTFSYIWSQNGVGVGEDGRAVTGIWEPTQATSDGRILVDIGTGISISASITGVTVNVPPSFAITGVANITGVVNATVINPIAITGNVNVVTTGNLTVNNIDTLTGQVAQLQTAINSLTGTVSSRWQKVNSSGFVQSFNPITGHCLINKVNIYSQCPTTTNFIQFFDNTSQVGIPDATLMVSSGANAYYEFSDEGTEFTKGLTVANSNSPISVSTGSADFYATVIYKML
jgi:hypothetical protein